MPRSLGDGAAGVDRGGFVGKASGLESLEWTSGSGPVEISAAAQMFDSAGFAPYHNASESHRIMVVGSVDGVQAACGLAVCTYGAKSKCQIVALAVIPTYRGKGLGQHLFNLLRAHAFYAASKKVDCPKEGKHWFLELAIGNGACSRRVSLLLLYAINGASVTAQAGEIQFSVQELSGLARAGKEVGEQHPDLQVHFPLLDLCEPYMDSRPFPVLATVSSCNLRFLTPKEVPPPPHWWDVAKVVDGWSYVSSFGVCYGLATGLYSIHRICPSLSTGCHQFLVWPGHCAQLEAYLQNPANHEEATRGKPSSKHYLLLKQGGVEKFRLHGFSRYSITAAKQHSDFEQGSRTAVASQHTHFQKLALLPGWEGILVAISREFGMTAKQLQDEMVGVHFFLQDELCQTTYGWHTDGVDIHLTPEQERTLTSVVVQLSAGSVTAMQVCGFGYQYYMGQGAAVAFHGGSLHRSIPWASCNHLGGGQRAAIIHKTVIFFKPR